VHISEHEISQAKLVKDISDLLLVVDGSESPAEIYLRSISASDIIHNEPGFAPATVVAFFLGTHEGCNEDEVRGPAIEKVVSQLNHLAPILWGVLKLENSFVCMSEIVITNGGNGACKVTPFHDEIVFLQFETKVLPTPCINEFGCGLVP